MSVQQYKMATRWHMKFVILNHEVTSKEIKIILRLFLVIATYFMYLGFLSSS